MLISQAFSPIALKNSTRIAFRYLKHQITYKEFWETSSRFSYFLQKEIKHGLRVGLWMSNCPQVAYCFIALANTKSCAVPLNPKAMPDENLFKIKNAGITVILCSSEYYKGLKEFLHQNGLGTINVIDMESKRCAEYDPSFTPPAGHLPHEKDQILLFYTPGTTGKHKGCLFSHNAVIAALNGVKGAYKATMTDVFSTQQHYSNPFNFIHYLLMPLAAGATVFISDHVDPKIVIPSLNEARVTRLAPDPKALFDLLTVSETEQLPLATLKNLSLQGVSFSKAIWDLIRKQGKIKVLNSYSMTEYLGSICMSTPDIVCEEKKHGFVGPAVTSAKIRVVDDNNDEIDKKKPQKGQLLVMGPALMDKYLDLPEEQKLTVRGTWLFTGDIVEVDKDGNVLFQDRKADVVTIKTGKKIFAREVEPIARQIKEIEDCAYIGVRDRLKKPLSALVVVRKEKLILSEKAIQDFLATKLAIDKRPDTVLFIDAMPRTISGAINRAKLRSQFDGV